MVAMGVLAVWLLLALVGAVAMSLWSRRLWKRRKELSPRATMMTVIVAASAMVGTLGTLVGLAKAFGAVGGESVDPSQKARMLGQGISQAMNCTAFGIVIGLPSAIILSAMMRKHRHRSE
jgi:biopolymer transport protein ExbB/TolQ